MLIQYLAKTQTHDVKLCTTFRQGVKNVILSWYRVLTFSRCSIINCETLNLFNLDILFFILFVVFSYSNLISYFYQNYNFLFLLKWMCAFAQNLRAMFSMRLHNNLRNFTLLIQVGLWLNVTKATGAYGSACKNAILTYSLRI